MPAQAARIIEPEQYSDPVSLRVQKALKGLGAGRARRQTLRTRERPTHLRLVKNDSVLPTDRYPGAPDITDTIRPANDNGVPLPSTSESAHPIQNNNPFQESTKRAAAATRHIQTPTNARRIREQLSPLPTAFTLQSRQSRDRFSEETEDELSAPTSQSDLPIETGGRVFLEPNVRSYALPEANEEEQEKSRQQAMNAQAARAFSDPFAGETPEWKRFVQEKSGLNMPEENIPSGSFHGLKVSSETIRQQLRVNAAERATPEIARAQLLAQFRTQAALRAAKNAGIATAADSDSLARKVQKKYVTFRLLLQTLGTFSTSLLSFFPFLLDVNLLAIKQHIAPELDLSPFYPRTTKPSIGLDVIAVSLTIFTLGFLLIAIGVPLALFITLVLPASHFTFLTIIYKTFAPLFGG